MSRDQREKLEEVRTACDPGNESEFSLVKSLLDKAVWYQIFNGIKNMGAGYSEKLEDYKDDFQSFIEDMKKAGVETGRMYKDIYKQLLEAFVKRWKDIKDQITNIPTEISTLMSTLINPLTMNAGIAAYFSFKRAFETLKRLFYETACILLDYEIYIMDESEVKSVAEVGEDFTKFIKGFVISGKGFVYLYQAVTVLDTLVNSLISVSSKMSSFSSSISQDKLKKLQEDCTDRTAASPYIMAAAKKIADNNKTFQGYLFEVITVEVVGQENDSLKTEKKRFQYLGCDIFCDEESDTTEYISCTSDYSLEKDGLAPISINAVKKEAREINLEELEKYVYGPVTFNEVDNNKHNVSIFEISDVVKNKKLTSENLSNYLTNPKIIDKVDSSIRTSLKNVLKTKVREVAILYKEENSTNWLNPNYWIEV